MRSIVSQATVFLVSQLRHSDGAVRAGSLLMDSLKAPDRVAFLLEAANREVPAEDEGTKTGVSSPNSIPTWCLP
jgi:hypothetical protein